MAEVHRKLKVKPVMNVELFEFNRSRELKEMGGEGDGGGVADRPKDELPPPPQANSNHRNSAKKAENG